MAGVSKAFGFSLRAINGEIKRKLKDGAHNRKYFNKDDLRYAYDKFNGACAKCGFNLTAAGGHRFSADFMLRVPIDAGGTISRDNLLLVCKTCKKEKRPKRVHKTEEHVFNFNTLADHVEQLTHAIVDEQDDLVPFFKKQLNDCLSDFVQTLYYRPIGGKCEPVEFRYEGENTVADLVADLAAAFKEINTTKEYTTLRRNK